MTSDERVLVGIDATGKPMSVAVVQRLTLNKLGDYSFAVPGPIADVEAAEGSDSEPGLRHDAILWAGFSSGTKTLAARATLRASAAAAFLPFRVSIARQGDGLVVRGENTSAAPGPVLVGPLSRHEAARAFAGTLRWLPLGIGAPDVYVTVPTTPFSRTEPIAAPLEVSVEIGGKRFSYRLGDGAPMRFELRVPRVPAGAKLRLVVTPTPPRRSLAPPGAATWAQALRRGRIPRTGLLERVSRVRLTLARELEYQTFLANPNSIGRSTAVYVYETAAKAAATPPSTSKETSRGGAWRTALLAALAVLAATAVLVLWAHS